MRRYLLIGLVVLAGAVALAQSTISRNASGVPTFLHTDTAGNQIVILHAGTFDAGPRLAANVAAQSSVSRDSTGRATILSTDSNGDLNVVLSGAIFGNLTVIGSITVDGGIFLIGSFAIQQPQQLIAPKPGNNTPTVAKVGTASTETTYCYVCAWSDGKGGITSYGDAGCIDSIRPGSLTSSVYNSITCPFMDGGTNSIVVETRPAYEMISMATNGGTIRDIGTVVPAINTPYWNPNELKISGQSALIQNQYAMGPTSGLWAVALGSVTATDNQGPSPDLTNDATSLAYTGNSQYFTYGHNGSLQADGPYVDSFYIKGNVGGEVINYLIYDDTASIQLLNTGLTVTTAWSYYTFTWTGGIKGHSTRFAFSSGSGSPTIFIYHPMRYRSGLDTTGISSCETFSGTATCSGQTTIANSPHDLSVFVGQGQGDGGSIGDLAIQDLGNPNGLTTCLGTHTDPNFGSLYLGLQSCTQETELNYTVISSQSGGQGFQHFNSSRFNVGDILSQASAQTSLSINDVGALGCVGQGNTNLAGYSNTVCGTGASRFSFAPMNVPFEVSGFVNGIRLTGSDAGAPVTIEPVGVDTNISLNLIPKGTGIVTAYASPVVPITFSAGSAASAAFAIEQGTCVASANACASQTLHFSSGTPVCTCSTTAAAATACSVSGVTNIAVVPKTGGATDTAHWRCIGLK